MCHKTCGCCRLFAHQDDADIDEPYTPPQGHTLGQGTCAHGDQLLSHKHEWLLKRNDTAESVSYCTTVYVHVATAQSPAADGGSGAEASGSQPVQPQSLKCDEYVTNIYTQSHYTSCSVVLLFYIVLHCSCGKLLKSEIDVQVLFILTSVYMYTHV